MKRVLLLHFYFSLVVLIDICCSRPKENTPQEEPLHRAAPVEPAVSAKPNEFAIGTPPTESTVQSNRAPLASQPSTSETAKTWEMFETFKIGKLGRILKQAISDVKPNAYFPALQFLGGPDAKLIWRPHPDSAIHVVRLIYRMKTQIRRSGILLVFSTVSANKKVDILALFNLPRSGLVMPEVDIVGNDERRQLDINIKWQDNRRRKLNKLRCKAVYDKGQITLIPIEWLSSNKAPLPKSVPKVELIYSAVQQ